jgi:hypothetical protein
MRGLVLSRSHLSPILLVSLLMLSTHLSWAQNTSALEKVPIQLLDTPAPFARVSEAQTRLHLTYRRLPLTFEQDQSRTESRTRCFPHYYSDYYRLPINTNAAFYPATRMAALWGKEKYLIGNAPRKWLTFGSNYGKVPYETTYSVENLQHFGHRIPWVGPLILRIGQQAKAHPHVTRLLTVLKPRL